MTKIICSDPSCKYQNDNGICSLKEITLTWCATNTKYDGMQSYNRCKNYEEAEDYKRYRKLFEQIYGKEK